MFNAMILETAQSNGLDCPFNVLNNPLMVRSHRVIYLIADVLIDAIGYLLFFTLFCRRQKSERMVRNGGRGRGEVG